MKRVGVAVLLLLLAVGAGCGEENPVRPPDELAPPTSLTAVTGEFTVDLAWSRSPFESSGRFAGYNVYVDTVSIAAFSDSISASLLEARKVNAAPVTGTSFHVLSLADGSSLVKGRKYYFHVRTLREDGRVSEASNEVDTAPRPEGDNDFGSEDLLMYDFDATTTSRSAFGWDRSIGDGQSYTTAEINENFIDFFMAEEPNSSDDGSLFLSPAQASFVSHWTVRHKTLFMDLGVGDAAWKTLMAPDTTAMTETVKVKEDHTYALYTQDGYWVKLRVVEFKKNLPVAGSQGTVRLNRVKFDYAFQLIQGYGRFAPRPGTDR